MKQALSLSTVLSILLLLGCHSLSPTGVYNGDAFLYNADLSIKACYDTVHFFVSWEKQNRPLLVKMPEVTKAADTLRKDFPKAYNTANALRDTYQSNPIDANRTALQTALVVIQTALTQAQTYMTQAATSTK